MAKICWERYRKVSANELTRTWLSIEANLGLAQNTIDAYGRALENYLRFSIAAHVEARSAVREHIAAYIHDLATLRNPKRQNVVMIDSGVGLAD